MLVFEHVSSLDWEAYQYYNLPSLKRTKSLRQKKNSRSLGKFPTFEKIESQASESLSGCRCLRGKVLFNFVWFDIRPGLGVNLHDDDVVQRIRSAASPCNYISGFSNIKILNYSCVLVAFAYTYIPRYLI